MGFIVTGGARSVLAANILGDASTAVQAVATLLLIVLLVESDVLRVSSRAGPAQRPVLLTLGIIPLFGSFVALVGLRTLALFHLL